MDKTANLPRSLLFLLTAACLIITVAGIKAAAPILIPFLLSVFIAIIFWPLLFWLKKKGIPDSISILLIVFLIAGAGTGLVRFLGSSGNDFLEALPSYQEKLHGKTSDLISWVQGFGIEVPGNTLLEYFDPSAAMKMAAAMLGGLGGVLTNSFLIFLTVILMLLESSALPLKMRAAWSDPDVKFSGLNQFLNSVKSYLAIKSLVSVATGFLVSTWLGLNGIDFAILWGVLAFMLNFVPNIGSFIAAAPAILLALVQYGPQEAFLVALGYVVINIIMGNFVEPKFLGRELGLSTLIVFLSLVFWGWVLGPVGMLLSVPLTMIVKIALESNHDTLWIALLMTPESTLRKTTPPGKGDKLLILK